MSTYTYYNSAYLGWQPYVAFGTRRLTETSPAQSFTEPLSLDEMKAYLKIPFRDPTDPAEDILLSSLISGARAIAEVEQGGLELIVRQWDHYFDHWPGYAIEVGHPLQSVELVQYRDSQDVLHTLTENVDYIVDTNKRPGLIAPTYGNSFPDFTAWPTSALLIRYTSGIPATDPWWSGDSGATTKNGMRYLVSEWYNKRLLDVGGDQNPPWMLRWCLSAGVPPRAR